MRELKQGSGSHGRAIVWVRGKTFKVASEAAALWQLKGLSENQTVLVSAKRISVRDVGPLEGSAAIVQQLENSLALPVFGNENSPFPVLWPLLPFPNLLAY